MASTIVGPVSLSGPVDTMSNPAPTTAAPEDPRTVRQSAVLQGRRTSRSMIDRESKAYGWLFALARASARSPA